MKAINPLLDKILIPIVLGFLIPIATVVGSKFSTGDWLVWFSNVPIWIWIVIGALITAWIIVIAIRRRISKLREDDHSPIQIISMPDGGWAEAGKIGYAGVYWIVLAPKNPWYELEPKRITARDLDMDTPPRCPKCETEIEQSKSFWGGYVWKCVRCDFQKRNRDSYYREKERALKVVKREWEIKYTPKR